MSWFTRKPNVLVKGTVAERPWAATLAAIDSAGHSGQLTLKSDGKVYQIAFANGRVVGAVSPAPADTVQRVALVNHLLQPASVAAAVRIMGRTDDVVKFADAAGITGDAAIKFKQRVIVQRVARTFDVERGEYVLEDKITIPVLKGVEVDVRAAIYHGMRMNLSEPRLTNDLRQLGARFILYPEAASFLEKFDFGADVDPILAELRGGTSVPELEALHRELDPRLVLAVLGALATCNVITAIEARRITVAQDIALARVPTQRELAISRVPTPRALTTFDSQKTTLRPSALTPAQIKQLISSRLAMLEVGVDYFTFLGVPFNSPPGVVRAAYLEIARYLRPERLAELRIHDERDEARAVFAQAVIAMTTLTDASRRAQYVSAFAAARSN